MVGSEFAEIMGESTKSISNPVGGIENVAAASAL